MRKGKNALNEIMSPVAGKIKLAVVLSGLGALCKVSAFIAFALAIEALSRDEMNFTFLGAAFAFVFTEMLLRTISLGVSHKAAFKLEQILRMRISANVAAIPYGETLNLGTGKIKKIMLDDVKNLHAYVADTTPSIGSVSVAPIASFAALAWFDWRLFLVASAMFLLGVVTISFAFKDNAKYQERYNNNQAKINASIIEFVQAMSVVRTFNSGENTFKRYDDALRDYADGLREWLSFSSVPSRLGFAALSPVPTYLALGVFAAIFYLNGSLNLGDLTGAMLTGTALVGCFMPVMMLRNFIMKSKISAESILSFLSIPALPVCPSPKEPASSDVEFKNVNFKYPNAIEPALKNVNFKADTGSVTALVGASGAGKSTAAMLLARYYDVSESEILIGGVDVKEIAPRNLTNLISFVFQDTFLFNESIYENIAKAKPNADKEEIIAAAKAANIHEFIESLPKGYDEIVGERGAKLSGGQKQRIAIARAILKDAPIIILDEPTAFVDPQSEEQIVKAVSNLIKNKTVIVVAHRLSTIKNADRILVFANGEIVESGTHDELISLEGAYAKLWRDFEQTQIWNVRR